MALFLMKRYRKSFDMFNRKAKFFLPQDYSGFQRAIAYIDYKKEKALYRISMANYFDYEFYLKNHRARRQFICNREMEYMFKVCNDPKYRFITGNKAVFNERFSSFLGRDWINVREYPYEEFEKYISNTERFFIKPLNGECGIGTGVIAAKDITDVRSTYEQYKASEVIIEGLITQHESLSRLNSSSVNTLRIVTLRDAQEKVHVMACSLRIGRAGEVVDNFHHRGLCAIVDLQTGIVKTTAVDAEHKRYVVHPDSKVPIVGFQIPVWDKVVETIIHAAKEMKELRYIGWDVAIGKSGQIQIVEGNSTPDSDVTQAPDQIGKWEQYKSIIKGIEMHSID